MNYALDVSAVTRNLDKLWEGLLVTLQLTIAANVIGVIAGFGLALLVLSRFAIVRWPTTLFVEFFRCTPALVQIVWFFYCVPMLFNVFLDPILMGVPALGLNLTAFNAEAYRASIRAVPKEHLDAGEVVICAGAFSGLLAKQLGEPIPLETERGYHTQIMSPGISMRHSIIWPARAFMVTPTAGGIRVGGTVEMAGHDAAPDYRRAKITVKRAKEALPNLRCEDFAEWMGHRPALPDTVPILSASAKTRGVFYASGHGHLGVTYAATTAQLMGDLINGAKPPIDLHPYRID